MPAKPTLLYVSPVVPALTGNGLAMRAGMVLEALAGSHRVSLLVVNLYAKSDPRVPAALLECCERVEVVDPAVAPTSFIASLIGRSRRRNGAASLAPFRGVAFDIVHAFRLATVSFARQQLAGSACRPRWHLDLDDIESLTHRRIAALCRKNGDIDRARVADAQARHSELAEEDALQQFDRVYVCSEADRVRLETRARGQVCVLPNAVRPAVHHPAHNPTPEEGRPVRLLFVGTLDYYPNEDAALHLCRDIVPRLRQMTSMPFGLDIIGGGASGRLREAAAAADVDLRGAVRDLEPWYEQSSVVVTPIRAGGGTRIKILEAFSRCRPVVSSSLGAEGLDVHDGREIVLADDPDCFSDACQCLMHDRERAHRMVQSAHALVERCHSPEAMRLTLDSSGR